MADVMEIKVIKRRSNEVRTSEEATLSTPVCAEREQCRVLLNSMIQGLVDYPETISVSYSLGDRTTVYKVECDRRCLGQIIGSKGKNISGVRAVIAAMMARKGIRAVVEIPYYCIET